VVATLANATVADNMISNVGRAGVASYYCASWTSDVIRAHQVSAAPTLVTLSAATGAFCGTTRPPILLSGNQFIGNAFRNGISTGVPLARMFVNMGSETVTGNLLQNNDFGQDNGPFLLPLPGFIDGGGNICGPVVPGLTNFVRSGNQIVGNLSRPTITRTSTTGLGPTATISVGLGRNWDLPVPPPATRVVGR